MLTPAAGRLLWGRGLTELTDRYVELSTIPQAGRHMTSPWRVRTAGNLSRLLQLPKDA